MERLKTLKRAGRDHGFTLIELMAVVVILGLLIGIVGLNVVKRIDEAKLKSTKIQISQLSSALDAFKMDNGFYPTTEQSLEALINEPSVGRSPKHYSQGGYLREKKVPKDAWDNPFNYREPGVKNSDTFDLWSNGPDAQEGTEDDITNWQE